MKKTTGIIVAVSLCVATLVSPVTDAADMIAVTTTDDTDDGLCDAHCSLREAIAYSSSGDAIDIPAGVYTLTTGMRLDVLEDLTLVGSGTDATIIEAAAAPHLASSEVFRIGDWQGRHPTVEISHATIRHGNGARVGGGIWVNGTLTLVDSTISHNRGQWGGGIFVEQAGRLYLINSTVSENVAHHFGYGGGSGGGGIAAYRNWDQGGLIFVRNSTIVGNTDEIQFGGSSAGGIYLWRSSAVLINTILADNADRQCGYWRGSSGYSSEGFESLGHNLDTDDTCALLWGLSDLPGVDPLLGPLQDNGGPTETHALLEGSPAIDAGDDSACPPTDQRGVSRPQGAASDIGAYESFREFYRVNIEIMSHWAGPIVPVAVLGSNELSVSDIDVSTLRFGPDEAPLIHDLLDPWTYNEHLYDVNLDGHLDLVSHYQLWETGIACGDREVFLTGDTKTGVEIGGSLEIPWCVTVW